MTKTECTKMLAWLSATWPRAFPPSMKDERRLVVLENLESVFDGIGFEQVKAAYTAALKAQDDVPTFAAIRTQCVQVKTDAKEGARRYNLDSLPEHHPRKGCFQHTEALAAYMRDEKAHKRNGRSFSWYCREYPATEWREWAMPELNQARIDDPNGAWHYMKGKEFAGWRTNENGFCVPVAK